MATFLNQPQPGAANAPARPWWETTPWWSLRPQLNDPTTWPVAAPVAGLFGGAQSGGPNWVPGLSPAVLKPIGGAWNAVAQGMAGAGQQTLGNLFSNPGVARAAAPAAAAPGMDWSFAGPQTLNVSNIVGAESAGNPNAKNPRSSAGGLGQFIDSTWMDADLRKRAGYDKIDDATWKALKVGEQGAAAQVAMTQAYAQRNAEQWEKKFGRAPDPGQLYGMHFLDAQPFMLLTETAAGSPQADAAKLFPQAAKANPEVFYTGTGKGRRPRTAAELYEEITRRGGGRDPFSMPDLQALPDMSGMIPNPTRPTPISLPNAPQMGAMPARPPVEELPVGAMVDQLRAFAPPAFDEAAANKGRLREVIAGLAAGAARANPMMGVGAVLAGAGAGASGAGAAFDREVKQDEKVAKEATRLFELSLARYGLDLQGQNRTIRQGNADRKWQDQRDEVTRQFTNASSQWEVDTKEYLANNGLENQYLRDLDQTRLLRARTAMQTIENNVELANRAATGQADLDLKRFLFENEKDSSPASDAQLKTMNTMLAGIGVDPKVAAAQKDSLGLNAAQGALYIAAKNKTAAINSLGREMALAGAFDTIPDKKVRGELESLAKRDPELAAAALGRLLNEGEASDPGSALDWAKVAAARGLPVGQLFLRHIQLTPKAPQQQQQAGGSNGGAR